MNSVAFVRCLCKALNKNESQDIPGHIGLEGNSMADDAAKNATSLDQSTIPLKPDAVIASLKTTQKSELVSRCSERPGYIPPDATPLPRRASCVLAQLRSEHSGILSAFNHRVGKLDSPTCRRCGNEVDTADHFIGTCPTLAGLRESIFGGAIIDAGVAMARQKAECWEFIIRAGLA